MLLLKTEIAKKQGTMLLDPKSPRSGIRYYCGANRSQPGFISGRFKSAMLRDLVVKGMPLEMAMHEIAPAFMAICTIAP